MTYVTTYLSSVILASNHFYYIADFYFSRVSKHFRGHVSWSLFVHIGIEVIDFGQEILKFDV